MRTKMDEYATSILVSVLRMNYDMYYYVMHTHDRCGLWSTYHCMIS